MKVLYEDNHLIVVVKPPNLLTQGDRTGDDNLLDQVKAYIKVTAQKPGNVYVGLVHRLDRPVGGVLVFAKTSKAASRLCAMLAADQVERRYLAVVHGRAQSKAQLTAYLKKEERRNQVQVFDRPADGAKLAVLNYERLEEQNGLTLLAVQLHTGRSHQIRAQLSHAGLPIYGDWKYGRGEKGGIALWCHKMCFLHPVKKEQVTFTAKPTQYPFTLFE